MMTLDETKRAIEAWDRASAIEDAVHQMRRTTLGDPLDWSALRRHVRRVRIQAAMLERLLDSQAVDAWAQRGRRGQRELLAQYRKSRGQE